MKIRITGMLLLITTLLSCLLVGCSSGNGEEDVDLVSSSTRSAVTLNFYIVTDEETTEEAKNAMQKAFNEVSESKYTTHVEFVFCTADEYQAELNAKYDRIEEIKALEAAEEKRQKEIAKSLKKAGITTLKQKTTTSGTTVPETMKDTIGMTVLKYPSLLETQLDILLITDREMFASYVDNNRLTNITSNINGNNKILKTYINDTLLNNAKYGGAWYGVPNNRIIGDYTYLFVNKEMAEKYYFTEENFTDFASCDTLIEYIAQNEDIAPVLSFADYPTLRYWSDDGDRTILATMYNTDSKQGPNSLASIVNVLGTTGYNDHMKQMFKYKEKGYFAADPDNCTEFGVGIVTGDYQLRNKYSEDYYTIVLDYPRLEEEFTYSSMLAVSSYTKNLDRAMEIITDLNTETELRNILQYGVEGVHYEVDENASDSDKKITVIKKLNNDYSMNIEHTGNMFMAYFEEGMDTNAWDYGKLQNIDSRISITYGALEHFGEVNTELMDVADRISKDYFAKMDQCQTLAEYEAWSAEVNAAIQQDNSVFQRLFIAKDREGEYDMKSPNGAMQYWYFGKYPLPE